MILTLYLVLKLRHYHYALTHWDGFGHVIYVIAGLIAGVSLAGALHFIYAIPIAARSTLGLWSCFSGVSLGPTLEEYLFRGCLLPLLAQTTGRIPAVILTAFLFSVFHQPADLAHWVSFTVTGLAYGWIRVVSGSTTAAAVMHATYNFALCCSATV